MAKTKSEWAELTQDQRRSLDHPTMSEDEPNSEDEGVTRDVAGYPKAQEQRRRAIKETITHRRIRKSRTKQKQEQLAETLVEISEKPRRKNSERAFVTGLLTTMFGLALLVSIVFGNPHPAALFILVVVGVVIISLINGWRYLPFKVYSKLAGDSVVMIHNEDGDVRLEREAETHLRDRPDPVERAKERYIEGDLSEEEFEEQLEQYEDALMADIEAGS